MQGVVRNDVFQRKADLYSGGLNLEYEGEDGWSAFFDFGYSRTDRNELSIESYSGTGFNWDDPNRVGDEFAAGDPTDTIGFNSGTTGTVFQPDPGLQRSVAHFPDRSAWLGRQPDRSQAGYYNNRILEDELKQYRLGVEKELDGFLSAVTIRPRTIPTAPRA